MVPLPNAGDADVSRPDAGEVTSLGHGVLSAVSVDGAPTELQTLLVAAMFEALTGHGYDAASFRRVDADEFAAGMARRNHAFRSRIVQTMILGALVVRPLPADVAHRVESYARAVAVDDGMLTVARNFAAGQLGLAAVDFDRNGYTADWSADRTATLHASGLAEAWSLATDDPALAARWDALGELAAGTLGRRVGEFYKARGFEFPGRPGSAPPLLAQHDWVHVLVDYGTKVESELEVFAFIARANDDPLGFSLLAMVVSLFETGYLARGAGLFGASPANSHATGWPHGSPTRCGAGLSHGLEGAPDVDFLALDWFALADQPLDELRRRFNIEPKSAAAIAVPSVRGTTGGSSPQRRTLLRYIRCRPLRGLLATCRWRSSAGPRRTTSARREL